MDATQAKLHEIDDKLVIVREAREKLARLDAFLVEQRKKVESDLSGRYSHMIRVSTSEMDSEIKRVGEILAKWQRR